MEIIFSRRYERSAIEVAEAKFVADSEHLASFTSTGIVATPVRKSIGGWISCAATTDQTDGAAKALAAALVVDCPVQVQRCR